MYKERHNSVVVWFIIWIIWDVLMALGHFTNSGLASLFGSDTSIYSTILGVLYLIDIVLFILILCWKYFAVIGIVVSAILKVIVMILLYSNISGNINTFFSYFTGNDFTTWGYSFAILGRVIFLAQFYTVLRKKKDNFSTLDFFKNKDLENNLDNSKNIGTKKCPFCANIIKREAIVCNFCNKDVPFIIPTHKVKLITNSDGMSLRKEPYSNLEPFTKLPNGTEIEYLETEGIVKLNGIKAPWFKIITKDNICGWCFSGSLEKL